MKKLFFIVVLFLAGLVAILFYLKEQEFVVVLSEAELQERLEGVFPVEERYLMVLTLRLSEPRVSLMEGADRIHYGMRATLTVPGVRERLSGNARVSGRLRYDEASRQLFLDDSVVEEIDIEGVPSAYRIPLREAADLLAGRQLDRHPVYTLEGELLEKLPTAVVVRDVRIVDGEVQVAFGLAQRFWERE